MIRKDMGWRDGTVQLKHEKKDEIVVMVVKTVHEYSWRKKGESFWEGGDDFGVDVLHFHTCLTDILSFLEKLEWWFEQYIDKEEERFEEMKMVGEENEEYGLANLGNDSLRM
uniref:Uncharacterized protein n=1 Tax=Tanacetum cinerariifolium TaxID=118510 RepID=A0A699LDF2_TANCI|nr:hypothetical protein [Tanacetum cinerariifolium]